MRLKGVIRQQSQFSGHEKLKYHYYPHTPLFPENMTSMGIIILITIMQVIYNYIPETHHVASVYSVAALLYLQSVLHVMLLPMLNDLYFYISTSGSVQCTTWLFFAVLNFVLSLYFAQVLSE